MVSWRFTALSSGKKGLRHGYHQLTMGERYRIARMKSMGDTYGRSRANLTGARRRSAARCGATPIRAPAATGGTRRTATRGFATADEAYDEQCCAWSGNP